jgi:hypothetical protein
MLRVGVFIMFGFLWGDERRRQMDEREAKAVLEKYGDAAYEILRQRARDKRLSSRNRKHWKRIARSI